MPKNIQSLKPRELIRLLRRGGCNILMKKHQVRIFVAVNNKHIITEVGEQYVSNKTC